MSALPQGWDFDYDGTRWFYTYKASGHIQYHFPSEGDEFPDFIDAASPAPALAPEERLESQRQQGRRAQTGTYGGAQLPLPSQGRGASNGMSATATPLSYAWEDDTQALDAPFQPESFMYLGPGGYTDISPLMEEEDEAARRVVAGSSPGSSMLSPPRSRYGGSPMQGQYALPAQSPRFSPHPSEDGSSMRTGSVSMPEGQEVHMLDGRETIHMLDGTEVIHMLDGREMPMELGGVTRFNPVGIVAEMETRETETARGEVEPLEMSTGDDVAPIERAEGRREVKTLGTDASGIDKVEGEVEKALQMMEEEDSSNKLVAPTGAMEAMEPGTFPDETEQPRRHEALVSEDAAPKHLSDPLLPAPSQEPPTTSAFKIARKPTSAKYQSYKPGQATDQKPKPATERPRDDVPIRRDPSLMYKGERIMDPDSVPESLTLRKQQAQDTTRRKSIPIEKWQQDGDDDKKGLTSHPSVLNPSTRANRDSTGLSNPTSSPSLESPVDPTADPGQGPAGVIKFPSVLKPARGRAPSMPPKQTHSWPKENRPKKSYEEDEPDRALDVEDARYVPYQSQGAYDPSRRPWSDVQPTIEVPPDFPQPPPSDEDRRVTTVPIVEATTAASGSNLIPGEQQHLPYRLVRANSSEVHQPTSISADPDGTDKPIAVLEAIPSLAFVNGGVPSPASSDQTAPFSAEEAATAGKTISSPDEVSPSRSRETSLSSDAPQNTPPPAGRLRRGSSIVSQTQTHDGMSAWTPSPQSESPSSTSHALPPPPRKLSGLRHTISDTAEDIDSPPIPPKIPLEPVPLGNEEEPASYFPAAESINRMSLPYSLLEDSDTSPAAPTPPPKHHERALLQRSKSMHEAKSPELAETVPVKTEPVETPSGQIQMGGHVLHAIEEDEEEPHEEILVAKRVVMKRHSVSSGSVQLSPVVSPKRGLNQGLLASREGHHRAVSQPVQSPTSKPAIQTQLSQAQYAPTLSHMNTLSPSTQPPVQQVPRGRASQPHTPQFQPPFNPHTAYQFSNPAQTASHQRSVSQPMQQQPPMPHQRPQSQALPQPLNPHQVPQWQLPQGPTHPPQHYPQGQQHVPPSHHPQQWHIPLPPPPSAFGTTTLVSSPRGQDKPSSWRKIFKKTPTKETAPISAPTLQTPPVQMHATANMHSYMPPNAQYQPQWTPGGHPPWNPHHPPVGNVQLPPAVGDRPGVSKIPGFEVKGVSGVRQGKSGPGPERMGTVRRGSALGSNPFDANTLPPLFDKETAP